MWEGRAVFRTPSTVASLSSGGCGNRTHDTGLMSPPVSHTVDLVIDRVSARDYLPLLNPGVLSVRLVKLLIRGGPVEGDCHRHIGMTQDLR